MDNVAEAAEWLAEKLYGPPVVKFGMRFYVTGVGDGSAILPTDVLADEWQPHLPTKEGFWQCFGAGGVVEKMAEKRWYFSVPSNNPDYVVEFWLSYIHHFRLIKVGARANTLTAAVTLAAARALGWEG